MVTPRLTLLASLILLVSLALPALSGAEVPTVDAPIVATFVGHAVTLEGEGFGPPGRGGQLLLRSGERHFRVASRSPRVEFWSDQRIVFALPTPFRDRSGWVRVRTHEGVSESVRVDVFEYDWFDIPPTPETNAAPLAIAVDSAGHVWVNQEFHLDFQMLDPLTGVVEGLPIPKPPPPGPFAWNTPEFGDRRTQTSVLGEAIIVDPRGRIWLTEGGGYLYGGRFPNHSRIVSYDPAAQPGEAIRIYNVPGDQNEVIGVAWDSARQRIWFAEGGLSSPPQVVSFDPERVPWDNHFDFSESLDHLVCPPEGPDDDCFKAYTLPSTARQPAHLLVDPDGFVWITAFWGNEIARLDPTTGEVEEFPLPDAIGQSFPASILGSGPWQILSTPDGDIVFSETFDSTLGRLSTRRIGDPACRQLDAAGRNPCIEELLVPEIDLVNDRVHSIAYDADGNLWFTQYSPPGAPTRTSLGFVTPDWKHVVRLPPLTLFPAEAPPSNSGVAIDPNTGDIWFTEFLRKRVGRLRYRPELAKGSGS